jgi:hypothetical protein
MLIRLVQFYSDYFTDDTKKDRYLPLRSSVCVSILFNMYSRFLNDSDIVPFEKISFSLKKNIVSRVFNYHENPVMKRRAAIAAYCLMLITSYE